MFGMEKYQSFLQWFMKNIKYGLQHEIGLLMMFVIGDEKKATQQHTHAKNRVHILCSVSYMQQQDEAVNKKFNKNI